MKILKNLSDTVPVNSKYIIGDPYDQIVFQNKNIPHITN